jgi:hypothetical protein
MFFTLLWPMLLGALIAGREGILFSGLVYLAFGCLFLGLLLIAGIRGVFSS